MRNIKLYKDGLLGFLTAAVLLGILMGAISYCCFDGDFLQKIGLAGTDFAETRKSMNFGRMMVSSLASSTVFLAVLFLCGLSSVGHPAEIAVLAFRGMGLGITVSQMYITFGTGKILYSILMVVPAAAVSTAAMIAGGREAVKLSNIYLRISFSDRQERGLLEPLKLYGAKFIVLEAVLAVSAGIECLCVILLKGRF